MQNTGEQVLMKSASTQEEKAYEAQLIKFSKKDVKAEDLRMMNGKGNEKVA